MAFKHPAKVIGNLCYLTPMSTEFAPEMAHFLADYSVAKFVRSFPSNYPIEKEIELIQNKVNDKTSRMFAVIDRVTEKFIGTCEICKIDTVDRTGEI